MKQYAFYYQLRTLPFVDEIWLFGSRSKHSNNVRSDIDLAIVCPKATDDDWQKIRFIIDQADTLLTIDCIRFDSLSGTRLKNEIELTKTVLFHRVPNNYTWYETFLDLGEALEKFQSVLAIPKDDFPYTTEAAIQIFEYTFELYWKLLKKMCADEGVVTPSPRSTFQQAYLFNLIDEEKQWLKMMEDRNLTSHTYQQPTANEIYENCKIHQTIMQKTYERLAKRFKLSPQIQPSILS